jgi:hypothetical protein
MGTLYGIDFDSDQKSDRSAKNMITAKIGKEIEDRGSRICNSEVYTKELCTRQNLYVQDRKDQ